MGLLFENFDAILTLGVAVGVMVGMAREWRPPEVLALTGAAVLLAAGVLDTAALSQVFSNQGALTIAAMFVVGGALQRTGAVELLARGLRWYSKRHSPLAVVIAVTCVVVVTSAFVSNTAIVVFLTPVVIALAREYATAPSRYLIPLSYVSILGGTCTLIGSSTNLLVDGVATQHGLRPFGLFEMTAPGVIMAIVGIVYLIVIGQRSLPTRKRAVDVADFEVRKRYLTELVITSSSSLAGKSVGKITRPEIDIVELIRGERIISVDAETELEPGDRVILQAPAGEALHLRGAAEPPDADDSARRSLLPGGYEVVREAETMIREGIVGPGSSYAGRDIGSLNLRRAFDVRILALHRQGREIRRDFERVQLEAGDILLLEGPPDGLKGVFDKGLLINLGEPILQRRKTEKAPIAIAGVALIVLVASFEIMPLAGIALIVAIAMLATGCLSAGAVRDVVDWSILFLIFGMLAIGRALETSGAVEIIVAELMRFMGELRPWMVLALIYLLSSLLTELVTNTAVAIIVTPVAINVAAQLGLDPRPFAVAVMFAGSASFATPLGYQTNTFVYGAGGYKFMDFVKIGVPMNVVIWLTATLLIPIFWPFH